MTRQLFVRLSVTSVDCPFGELSFASSGAKVGFMRAPSTGMTASGTSERMMIGAVDVWKKFALFTVPDADDWTKGTIALLGDAAHAMLPFAAQGAAMAIEDAMVLAKCLGTTQREGGPAIAAALQRYAKLRRGRVAKVARAARRNGTIYHLSGPLALARDLTIRAMGPRARVLSKA